MARLLSQRSEGAGIFQAVTFFGTNETVFTA